MWIVRWIVLLLIIVAVLGFSLQNQSEMVSVRLLGWESGPVPLYLALFIAFGFGMVAFLLIAVFQQLQTLADLARERKGKKKVEQQLEQTKQELELLQLQLEDSQDNKVKLDHELKPIEKEADIEPARLGVESSGGKKKKSKPRAKRDS